MKAVMYGAGNIGRGFIAQLFTGSGYHTTFVDVVDSVVNELNEKNEYPLYITRGDEYERTVVSNVDAVNGRDADAVAEAISEADVMATAVGVNVMKFIAEPVARGVSLRIKKGGAPLNIIICENKIDANTYFRGLVSEYLNDDEKEYFNSSFGLVEASIGRMVPSTPAAIREKEPLAVCVEPYCSLPVDKDAFVGKIPEISNMIAVSPFQLYIERKLYMHNMSHAVCAYLGNLLGYKYIWEAAGDPRIRFITLGALSQSANALSAFHHADVIPLTEHGFDLLTRYDNKLLGDTVARVGNDTRRKLSSFDRIPGAIKRAVECGVSFNFIAAGFAAGLLFSPENDASSAEVYAFTRENGVEAALIKYSETDDPRVVKMVSKYYRALDDDPVRGIELIMKNAL